MINEVEKQNCIGCAACVQICPKKCIIMCEDKEGFLYPKVIVEKCVQCKKCVQVCPACNNKKWEDVCKISYAAYAKETDIREKSSSGGVFTLLAEYVIEEKGIVFGAVYDEKMTVHHIGVETREGLALLRGSKYLQSRIEDTFIKVRKALEQERKVLFTGTGCQIAGLKRFLQKEYDNLLTVDILCHGVPSPKVWMRYIREQENRYGAQIEHVSFRSKKLGWKKFGIELQFTNSLMYENIYYNDDYMKLFLGNICLRPSCHNCKYKKLDRSSDLTIGDAWGIGNHLPLMDDDRGTSIILVHSVKGLEVFEKVKAKMIYCAVDTEILLPASADSRNSVSIPLNRKKFFRKLDKKTSIEKLVKCLEVSYLCRIKKKIKRLVYTKS